MGMLGGFNEAKYMSKRNLIRYVADKVGWHYEPKHYISVIWDTFNCRVDNAEVCKAIGKYKDRTNMLSPQLASACEDLLRACNYNVRNASKVLKRYAHESNQSSARR